MNKLSPEKRLHACPFPLVGLTGGIATGKSTVSEILSRMGYTVICADKLIHEIYQESKVLELVQTMAPHAILSGKISFPQLRKEFFQNSALKEKLESLLYSYLPQYFKRSLPPSAPFIFYDVPLLFEKKMEDKFDWIVSVVCQPETQIERIQKRDPQTSEETILQILKSQLPLEEKRKLADYVIENEGSQEELEAQISDLISDLVIDS